MKGAAREALTEVVCAAIMEVRNAYPRLPDDVDSYLVTRAALSAALPEVARLLRESWRNGSDDQFHALQRAADYVEALTMDHDPEDRR